MFERETNRRVKKSLIEYHPNQGKNRNVGAGPDQSKEGKTEKEAFFYASAKNASFGRRRKVEVKKDTISFIDFVQTGQERRT